MGGKNKVAAEQCSGDIAAVGGGTLPGAASGSSPCVKHWVGVRVVDEDGNVVRDIRVSFELTDGSDYTLNLSSQTLEADGTYRTKTVLPDGVCKFGLPDIQDVEWWPQGEAVAAVPANHDDDGGDGACAVSIADDRGFRNYHSFWDDAANQPLRDKNRNPNQLNSKDSVHYSKSKTKLTPKGVDYVWTLVVKKVRPVQLLFILWDHTGHPLAGAQWALQSPIAKNGTTGPDGRIQIDNLPPQEKKGELNVTLPARATVGPTPANPPGAPLAYPPPLVYTQFTDPAPQEPPDRNKANWKLKVGSLDPFDITEGIRERLGNLGFRCKSGSNDEETTRAVKAYQRFFLNNRTGSGKTADIQDDLHTRHDNP